MIERDERIIQINVEEQMRQAYIDYSMSVIVQRALPDVGKSSRRQGPHHYTPFL